MYIDVHKYSYRRLSSDIPSQGANVGMPPGADNYFLYFGYLQASFHLVFGN
jgi:hypothetical protein